MAIRTYRPIFSTQPQPNHTWQTKIRVVRYNGAVTDARSALRVDESHHAGSRANLLALVGELDLATIAVLKDAVSRRLMPDAYVVLDLAELTFCDSTGLGAFVALFRDARNRGARFALAAPRKRIGDLFTLSGIDQVIPVFDSPATAIMADTDAANTKAADTEAADTEAAASHTGTADGPGRTSG